MKTFHVFYNHKIHEKENSNQIITYLASRQVLLYQKSYDNGQMELIIYPSISTTTYYFKIDHNDSLFEINNLNLKRKKVDTNTVFDLPFSDFNVSLLLTRILVLMLFEISFVSKSLWKFLRSKFNHFNNLYELIALFCYLVIVLLKTINHETICWLRHDFLTFRTQSIPIRIVGQKCSWIKLVNFLHSTVNLISQSFLNFLASIGLGKENKRLINSIKKSCRFRSSEQTDDNKLKYWKRSWYRNASVFDKLR